MASERDGAGEMGIHVWPHEVSLSGCEYRLYPAA